VAFFQQIITFCLWHPDDAFDHARENVVNANKGYDGSSLDHFYTSMDGNSEIGRREVTCTCDPCLETKCGDCKLEEVFDSEHGVELVHSAKPPKRMKTRGGNTFEEFVASLQQGVDVIAQTQTDEKPKHPDEEHFVAHLKNNLHKLTEGGMHSINECHAGHCVVDVRWFAKEETDRNEDQWCKWSCLQTMQCNSLVKVKDMQLLHETHEPGRRGNNPNSGKLHKLKSFLDDKIKAHGDLGQQN